MQLSCRRYLYCMSVFAQDHSSEQFEAQITGAHYHRSLRSLSLLIFFYEDPNIECTVYYYPPTAASAQNIHGFTRIWLPATPLSNDSNIQVL
jgi:hypothetical protein